MSISSITYANRYEVINKDGDIIPSMLSYKSNSDNVYVMPVDGRITLNVAAGETMTRDLITYKNNTKLSISLEHKADWDSGVSRYKHYYNGSLTLTDPDGNVINKTGLRFPASISFGPPYYASPYLTYLDQLVFFYSGTYYDRLPDSIVGDAAALIKPFGVLYMKLDNLGAEDLVGIIEQSQITGHWAEFSLTPSVLNDADYNSMHTSWIESGTGEDPITTGEPSDDPDPSTPGGGDKPSKDGGDVVDFPGLPTTNVLASGLVTMYNPTNTELTALASELWSNTFESSISKILNDPFDALIGLSLVPFSPHTSGSVACEIGNYQTSVNMPIVDQQYKVIDCGYVNVQESWKNALDYSPFTKLEVFIPFCGFKTLKVEDVMGKKLYLKYNIDLLSGAAVAMLKCDDKVLYTYPCKLTYDVPLTGSNKSALYTGMINVAMSALHGAALGGAIGAAGGAATSAIQTATSKQSDVDRSGAVTSNTGDLGEFIPYIVIHRPVQSMPQGFKTEKGYQSNISATLSSLTGYTEVEYIHLTGISGATDSELNEIERLLKDGVII